MSDYHSAKSGGIIGISLSIFFNLKNVCCMLSVESPHRGDSKEYTQYIIFNIKKENFCKLSEICRYGFFSKGVKNEFETAVVNEPLVFEPLKFYCTTKIKVVIFLQQAASQNFRFLQILKFCIIFIISLKFNHFENHLAQKEKSLSWQRSHRY